MLQKNYPLKQERFRVIRQLNTTTNGTIYEAYDNTLKTNVTLKEFSGNSKMLNTTQKESQNAALTSETRILFDIKHNSIFQVYDYFSEAEHNYLAMENAEGTNLRDLLRKGSDSLTFLNVLKWADELLNVLNYLHSQKVPLIHCNLKPENIILTSEGKIKLTPFGITQTSESNRNSVIAEQTFDAANLHYSPLEQIWLDLDPASQKTILNNYDDKSARILESPLDARTDIYSLGATLYHLFTKTLPIDALERSIDILEGKNDPLSAPKLLNSNIPVEISEALLKAMQIKREDRFDSAAAMQKVFKTALPKNQIQELPNKYQDDEDLLEIDIAVQKPLKPVVSKPVQKKPAPNTNKKQQAEQQQTQLSETNIQGFITEQDLVETEKPLITQQTKIEESAPIPVIVEPTSVVEERAQVSDAIEPLHTSVETAPILLSTQTLDADAVKTSVFKTQPADEIPSLFSEPPTESRTFQRMAIGAVILAVLGGAGWGIFNFTKSNPVELNQTSLANTVNETEKLSTATQTALPEKPAEAATGTAEQNLTNTQTASETNPATSVEPAAATETATSSQPSRNKAEATSSQRTQRQTPTPPKIASVEKKPVTVDDIINDN